MARIAYRFHRSKVMKSGMGACVEILILRTVSLVLRDAASRRLLRIRETVDSKDEDFRSEGAEEPPPHPRPSPLS
jgi:hypothetical protein